MLGSGVARFRTRCHQPHLLIEYNAMKKALGHDVRIPILSSVSNPGSREPDAGRAPVALVHALLFSYRVVIGQDS